MTQKPLFQIVIARTEETMTADAGNWTTSRGDGLNAVAALKPILVPKVAMWKRRATEKDMPKAEAYAVAEGYTVFTFHTAERNALALAKAQILAT